MRLKTPRQKSKTRNPRVRTSREKVRAHRQRLRAKGLRPIQIWVPDTRSPEFAAEARRQCLLANASPFATEDQAFMESLADWKVD